jgi:hydrogenase expression/formation protein HypE
MHDKILLGHGSGGRLTRDLIRDVFLKNLGPAASGGLDDGAMLQIPRGEPVFTTDSYVVNPLTFPGGDIGTLAVSGTVNDLAVMGARPLFLSLGVILEEGLETAELERIIQSMRLTAEKAGVLIVCGDTKVVEKGKGDKIFINTSGIGTREKPLAADKIQAGDKVIINGTVGDHGMALLCLRSGFPLKSGLKSDCTPLNRLVLKVLDHCHVKWMRDPTRGGVATALNELAEKRAWGVRLKESALPFHPAVEGISEILGLDPLYSANEGKALMVVSPEEAASALRVLRNHPHGRHAQIIGEITGDFPGKLTLETKMGTLRTLGILNSDPLPRIC